jgi:hypothetical protein
VVFDGIAVVRGGGEAEAAASCGCTATRKGISFILVDASQGIRNGVDRRTWAVRKPQAPSETVGDAIREKVARVGFGSVETCAAHGGEW